MAFFNKRYHLPGTSPGTLTKSELQEDRGIRIRRFEYCAESFSFEEDVEVKDCRASRQDGITWVHVEGRVDPDLLTELGKIFQLHALAMEDVLNSGQRPKIEPFHDQLFIVMSMPFCVDDEVDAQQVSLFLSSDCLVSFCETEFSVFQPIVKRLREKDSRLRSKGIDFLLYSLLDLSVDLGFPLLEDFGERLEDLEDEIFFDPDRATVEKLHSLKRDLILLRRTLWPQREVINQLVRGDHAIIKGDTLLYLRDCYDHTIQVMDLLETYRDMSRSMLDIYLSSTSNRMNEIMRVLTVISTIFIPLTFIAGIYGMNFDHEAGWWNMPELKWPYGYLATLGAMGVITVSMLFFFRRKGWL